MPQHPLSLPLLPPLRGHLLPLPPMHRGCAIAHGQACRRSCLPEALLRSPGPDCDAAGRGTSTTRFTQLPRRRAVAGGRTTKNGNPLMCPARRR